MPNCEASACAIACGRCGSIATGVAEAWEQVDNREPGLSLGELKLLRRQVAQEIVDHQRAQGWQPGHWQRWANQELKPKVNWRQELAALVRRALSDAMGASDYTYTRPSRRQGAMAGIILPALRQPVPNVAIIADTSGSMTGAMLSRTLAEIEGVLAAVGQREGVQVYSVDAIVQNRQRVTRVEQVELAGGGGTNMGAGLDALNHCRPRPDVAIVITDGYTPWPSTPPPGIRVVVALTQADGAVPSWAKSILVAD